MWPYLLPPLDHRRAATADALGLAALLFLLLDCFRPALLLLPTIAAGGDTPCHYPTAAWVKDELLPRGQVHGWFPGGYLGHPLLLYYFPLPFWLMAALSPLVGLPVAFKIGVALGVFLLPPSTYLGLRLMGYRFPSPLLGAAAATIFLFVEENPIWGGTIASTLAGEFSYTYGTAAAVLFLGAAYRAYARGDGPWVPAALLALTGILHGYAVLWAGLASTFFLYRSRAPWRTLRWLLAVAGLSFAFIAFWILPLLSSWGWTTPYDDPWITVEVRNLVPPLLWPLVLVAVAGLVSTFTWSRPFGGADQRLLFLLHAAAVAGALALAGPALGIIDVRFVPFAQLAVAVAGGASIGVLLRGLVAADAAALGLVLLSVAYADATSQVVRPWIDWNYTGLEAKELWPAWSELSRRLRGTVADPRVAVEYSKEHEKAGSIRMYETLPFFSGRSTLEGVYNQASLSTHAVYYVSSELGALSPNPFRNRHYSGFDTEAALAHLRLFNTREVVALSSALMDALAARSDVEHLADVPPYGVYRLRDTRDDYVEPLTHAPVRSSPDGYRDAAYRWFTRKPLPRSVLVFTDDPRFAVGERDPWLPPPEVPLDPGVTATSRLEPETIHIRTSRVGHPLLVKVSYHPRWRAEGADGPYLAAPSLMLVVPRQHEVRLTYARTPADHLGAALSLGALLLTGAAGLASWRRRGAPPPPSPGARVPPEALDACEAPPPPRRWGGLVAGGLLILLAGARLAHRTPDHAAEASRLDVRAGEAYAAAQYVDAAEFAAGAARLTRDDGRRAELKVLQAESLLRAGRPGHARVVFQEVVADAAGRAYLPQALSGVARAAEAMGDRAAAEAQRARLQREFANTPWAREGPFTRPRPTPSPAP